MRARHSRRFEQMPMDGADGLSLHGLGGKAVRASRAPLRAPLTIAQAHGAVLVAHSADGKGAQPNIEVRRAFARVRALWSVCACVRG